MTTRNAAGPHQQGAVEMRLLSTLLLTFAVAVASTGCRPGYQLDTAKVSGRVTYQGKPVTQGVVIFIPPRGRRASGTLDGEGRYRLGTYHDADGAIVGTHKVGVIAYADMEQYYKAAYDDTADHAMPEPLVPESYNDPANSGLTYEVTPGSRNQADFDL